MGPVIPVRATEPCASVLAFVICCTLSSATAGAQAVGDTTVTIPTNVGQPSQTIGTGTVNAGPSVSDFVAGGTNTGPTGESQSSVNNVGTLPPAFTKRPEPSDFAALLTSFIVWCLAFFLLHDAGRFQKWQSADDDHAPDPLTGIGLAWVVSLSAFVAWGWYVATLFRLEGIFPDDIRNDPLMGLLVLGVPRLLVPGVLIAALFPAAVAVFKYVTASLATRTPGGGPRLRGLVGALVALINLGASVATLVMFRVYLFGPSR
jgi:hypothetical protein